VFGAVKGYYVRYIEDIPDACVKSWNVQHIGLSRKSRHLDRVAQKQVFGARSCILLRFLACINDALSRYGRVSLSKRGASSSCSSVHRWFCESISSNTAVPSERGVCKELIQQSARTRTTRERHHT
jgi:hypothetical protein